MNKRIKELKQQAADYVDSIDDGIGIEHYRELLDQKFAELMIVEFTESVKETAHLVAQTAYNDGESMADVAKRTNGALSVLGVMRKRFGVEE